MEWRHHQQDDVAILRQLDCLLPSCREAPAQGSFPGGTDLNEALRRAILAVSDTNGLRYRIGYLISGSATVFQEAQVSAHSAAVVALAKARQRAVPPVANGRAALRGFRA